MVEEAVETAVEPVLADVAGVAVEADAADAADALEAAVEALVWLGAILDCDTLLEVDV